MRHINIMAAVLAMVIVPFVVGAQEPHIEVTPRPLEVHGDSVKFTATITMPKDKVFKNEGTFIIRPELGGTQFKPIKLSKTDLGTDPNKNGFTVTVNGSAYFVEDMIGNDLEIESEYAYKQGKKEEEFRDVDELGKCCITTGTLFSTNGQYEYMKFDYTPASSTQRKVVAQINFPIDVAKFPVNQSQDQINVIGEYLKTNPDARITIRGFASPEGPVDNNRRLAEERSEVAKEWLVNALKSEGYGQYINPQSIEVESTTEDWKGLIQLVRQSDVDQKKKTEILNIVSTTQSLKDAEDKLYKVVGNYDDVEKFMRPLRRATIVVASENATRQGYSVAQIDSITNKVNKGEIPHSSLKDIFNQEEYLQAYVQNDAEQGKLTLLTSYMTVYPSDTRVYSDLGALTAVDLHKIDIIGGDDALAGVGFDRDKVDVDTEFDMDEDKFKFKYKFKEEDTMDPEKVKVKVKMKDLEEKFKETEGILTRAYEAEPTNFVTQNNLGAFYLTTGEYHKAKEYLTQSAKIQESEGVNYNLGVYHARMGNYDKAAEYLNKVKNVEGVEYNRGLARLMTGDNEGALRDFQDYAQNNAEYAIAHYLTAVAAARANNEQTMYKELEHAINRDRRLADVAEEDLEFRMYWDNDKFEEAADDDFTQLAEDESDDDQ